MSERQEFQPSEEENKKAEEKSPEAAQPERSDEELIVSIGQLRESAQQKIEQAEANLRHPSELEKEAAVIERRAITELSIKATLLYDDGHYSECEQVWKNLIKYLDETVLTTK